MQSQWVGVCVGVGVGVSWCVGVCLGGWVGGERKRERFHGDWLSWRLAGAKSAGWACRLEIQAGQYSSSDPKADCQQSSRQEPPLGSSRRALSVLGSRNEIYRQL